MEAFPRYSTRPGYSSSYQVNEASKQLVSFSLYSPIIRHLGNTDRHRTRKGQKKKSERGREKLTDFFLQRRKPDKWSSSRFGDRNQGKF